MMHLRVANLANFNLNEPQKIKLRSMKLNRKANADKFAKWASSQTKRNLILNIWNNPNIKLPLLSSKLTSTSRKY